MVGISLAHVNWTPSYRIIPSRFPPVGLFDRVANPADLEAVFALEAMTNDRLRDEAGEIELVPSEDRIAGPGTTCIMSAFTHINTYGSRFSNGAYGVYYCALEQDTAVAETVYHRSRFLSATKEDAMEIDMRVYLSDLNAELHDLREIDDPLLYDLVDYSAGQQLGLQLKNTGSYGAIYRSVRHAGGQCAALFRPTAFVLDGHQCRQGAHLTYRWDGKTITAVYEKKNLVTL